MYTEYGDNLRERAVWRMKQMYGVVMSWLIENEEDDCVISSTIVHHRVVNRAGEIFFS